MKIKKGKSVIHPRNTLKKWVIFPKEKTIYFIVNITKKFTGEKIPLIKKIEYSENEKDVFEQDVSYIESLEKISQQKVSAQVSTSF